MDAIDLRSDTVTWPTPEMREAMAQATVGDDVYGEDPTVNQLQEEAAAIFGKEAGLFVPSGTMGNLASVLAHCERGAEVIVGNMGHAFRFEAGGMAVVGGIQPHTVPVQPDATMRLEDIRAAIRPNNAHFPPTRLIMLENTHNAAGGQPITVEYTNQVAAIAKEHGIKLHIDGARIFNAAAALGVDVKALTEQADSVTFCLSKGLCAPVGSVIVGSREFIKRAHRMRKVVGGGMRQAGVLAAAGLVALRTMPQRLHEDHTHAALLAEGLSEVPYVKVLSNATNFVFITLEENSPYNAPQLSEILKRDYNIIISPYPGVPNKIRLVTHYWITQERVEQAIEAFKTVLS